MIPVHAALENRSRRIAVVYTEDEHILANILASYLQTCIQPAFNLHPERTREMPLSGREPKYVSEAHVVAGSYDIAPPLREQGSMSLLTMAVERSSGGGVLF